MRFEPERCWVFEHCLLNPTEFTENPQRSDTGLPWNGMEAKSRKVVGEGNTPGAFRPTRPSREMSEKTHWLGRLPGTSDRRRFAALLKLLLDARNLLTSAPPSSPMHSSLSAYTSVLTGAKHMPSRIGSFCGRGVKFLLLGGCRRWNDGNPGLRREIHIVEKHRDTPGEDNELIYT